MTDAPGKPDILYRLRFYADHVDDVPVKDLEAVLHEAGDAIVLLRDLVGIKEEIWLEDEPPQGHG